MTSYQDEHAPIKFMTGVPLNIIMGPPFVQLLSKYFQEGEMVETEGTDCCLKQKKTWVSHMFLVTPRSTNTS